MKNRNPTVAFAVAVVCGVLFAGMAAPLPARSPSPADERIGIPGPIRFGSQSFALAWTSHPAPDQYKQEYLPAGESVDHYSSMLMIDLTTSAATGKAMARKMIESLEARKASDPVVNYQVITNPANGELILDFVLSASGADGKDIIEWSAYRYSSQGKGVRMVGISRRAYGNQVDPFLRKELSALRTRDIAALSALTLPPTKPRSP
jgi:hypothetical protein